MTTDTVPQTVLFPDLFDKPLFAKFNQEQASSDGGAVLLKAAERVYGLVKAFARCLSDKRAPEKIRHTLADLIGQRIFGIACGHPDCNDAAHLADGRDPVAGESLASQPTLSRFENAAGRGALYDMGCELAARVVERHRRRLGRVRRITIDLDPTDDPTHGAQQYSLFNGYYDNWCYLPLLAFLTFDREPEQYLCSAVLRHGKAVASEGGVALLARLLPLLRCAFPRARFLVRLDGGFASPALFDFLGAQPRLDYVVAMASNAVLLRHAEPAMLVARARSERSEQTEHLYMDTDYAAGTWSAARRVIIKAEVVRLGDREPRDNPRFVVTNMRQTPRQATASLLPLPPGIRRACRPFSSRLCSQLLDEHGDSRSAASAHRLPYPLQSALPGLWPGLAADAHPVDPVQEDASGRQCAPAVRDLLLATRTASSEPPFFVVPVPSWLPACLPLPLPPARLRRLPARRPGRVFPAARTSAPVVRLQPSCFRLVRPTRGSGTRTRGRARPFSFRCAP